MHFPSKLRYSIKYATVAAVFPINIICPGRVRLIWWGGGERRRRRGADDIGAVRGSSQGQKKRILEKFKSMTGYFSCVTRGGRGGKA